MRESSRKRNQASSSSKTSEACSVEEWERSSGTFPVSGMMRAGTVSARPKSERPTFGAASGSSPGPHLAPYPTPSASRYGTSGNGSGNNVTSRGSPSLETMAKRWPTATAGDAKRSGSRAQNGVESNHSGTSLTDATCRPGLPHPPTCNHGGECQRRLNPRFVLWLMGFPADWFDGATKQCQLPLFGL